MADDKDTEENQDTESFQVNDKRRFDEDGNLKSSSKAAVSEEDTATAEEFVLKDSSDAGPGEVPGVDFSSFILSLATQALVQLGEMPPPEGMSIEKNVQGAKQMIDVVGMLAEKTKGNLTEAEQNLVDEILHNLRLSFVKHSQ